MPPFPRRFRRMSHVVHAVRTFVLGSAVALLGHAALAGPVVVLVKDGNGQPLNDAVVSLFAPGVALRAPAGTRSDIEQRGRQFVPQVSVVQAGTAVYFPNRDKVQHHVYSFSPAKTFELKLYSGTPAAPVVFDQAGTAVLGCNIHDQMAAWVRVVETPYFAKTTGGAARIEQVPAGDYRLQVWHASWPSTQPPHELPLTVPAAGASVSVQLPAGR